MNTIVRLLCSTGTIFKLKIIPRIKVHRSINPSVTSQIFCYSVWLVDQKAYDCHRHTCPVYEFWITKYTSLTWNNLALQNHNIDNMWDLSIIYHLSKWWLLSCQLLKLYYSICYWFDSLIRLTKTQLYKNSIIGLLLRTAANRCFPA